jgi:hypothetical protein
MNSGLHCEGILQSKVTFVLPYGRAYFMLKIADVLIIYSKI